MTIFHFPIPRPIISERLSATMFNLLLHAVLPLPAQSLLLRTNSPVPPAGPYSPARKGRLLSSSSSASPSASLMTRVPRMPAACCGKAKSLGMGRSCCRQKSVNRPDKRRDCIESANGESAGPGCHASAGFIACSVKLLVVVGAHLARWSSSRRSCVSLVVLVWC